MKKILSSALIIILGVNLFAQNDNTVTILGQVTDFDGNPIDSCWVALLHENFNPAYETISDKAGYYVLSGVEKGRYFGMYALRLKEYPRENAVPDEKICVWSFGRGMWLPTEI